MPGDEARQNGAQLRQLDLNLALGGLRALREDVEDELRAVYDLEVCGLGDRAHLRRAYLSVEDDEVCAESERAHQKLVELAAAQDCARVNGGPSLDNFVERSEENKAELQS